ncbi:MAG: tetratricopeptide repeat protein, partial [Candidatus Limnocylindria bacterium]
MTVALEIALLSLGGSLGAFAYALRLARRRGPSPAPTPGASGDAAATESPAVDETEQQLRRTVELREAALGPDHPDVATALAILASHYQSQHRYGAAEPVLRQAIAARERAFGIDHLDVVALIEDLGVLAHARGRLGEAEALFRRSLATRLRVTGRDHPDVAGILFHLAAVRADQEDDREAETLLREALSTRERLLGRDHPEIAPVLTVLGRVLQRTGRLSEATAALDRAVTLAIASEPATTRRSAILLEVARTRMARGDLQGAEPVLRSAISSIEGGDGADTAELLDGLARVLTGLGREGEAEELLRESLSTRER